MSGRIWDSLVPELRARLRGLRRAAVLGIKTEQQADQPAFYVPKYLVQAGVEVIPVPVYYPEATQILGAPVRRSLRGLEGVELVNVFRRPADLPAHLAELLELRPPMVWLQQGIRHDLVACKLAEAGIDVVQDRCLMVDHRRALAEP
ncbi:MAG: CoA-binding protein [Polyangiaceae bacterium]|jgi:hypothetical protein|nr:CoA-binding protein [Polyangiaceae bacterium]